MVDAGDGRRRGRGRELGCGYRGLGLIILWQTTTANKLNKVDRRG